MSQPPDLTSPSAPVSVWQLKPWWCQPWSILLTGFGAIGGSWFLFHRVWVTGLVSVPMVTWMVFFVVIYPAVFAQYQQDQRTQD